MEGAKGVRRSSNCSWNVIQVKMGDLTKVNVGDLTQTKMGDLTQTKMGDLTQTKMGASTQVKMGDLTQVKTRDVSQPKMGDLMRRQRQMGASTEAKKVDLREVWLLRMVIHLLPKGPLELGMGPWGLLQCCQMMSPCRRHQCYELPFLLLTSSNNRVYQHIKSHIYIMYIFGVHNCGIKYHR